MSYGSQQNKSYIGWAVGISSLVLILIFFGFIIFARNNGKGATSSTNSGILSSLKAIVYKTANCGCCGVYAKYLPKEGVSATYKDITNDEMDQMKKDLKISKDLASCHITKIGDYFVSGHIPIEIITKLMTDKPDIAGIALAGMPSGTPGMPGPKNQSWDIYAIDKDGSTSSFMSL